MPLDVLVPGLVPPSDAPAEMRALRLPALEKWLARADVTRDDARSSVAWLAGAFSLGSAPPVAAVSLAAESEDSEGAWLHADPVHIRIARDRTSMHAGAILEIEAAEALALVVALNAHFHADGLEFRAPSPERWYVRVPAEEIPVTIPLDEALGRDVQKLVPAARGRIKWPAALTEVQMLFAAHDVNTKREREGRPAINSVWLWGGGERPARIASPYAAVHADEAFARGLATVAGTHLSPAPRSLAEVPSDPSARILAMSSTPLQAIRRGNAGEWVAAAQSLDGDWFGGIGDAIGRFGGVRIVLPVADGTVTASLSSGSRWRLHRRRKPMAAYV